jgi:hypothetical protein
LLAPSVEQGRLSRLFLPRHAELHAILDFLNEYKLVALPDDPRVAGYHEPRDTPPALQELHAVPSYLPFAMLSGSDDEMEIAEFLEIRELRVVQPHLVEPSAAASAV